MKRHPDCELDEWECRAPACSCSVIIDNVMVSMHSEEYRQWKAKAEKRRWVRIKPAMFY